MPHSHTIDLSVLPAGNRYEDTYGAYLDIFSCIALIPPDEKVLVVGAPYCWVPLLWHLNCDTTNHRVVFEHCTRVKAALGMTGGLDRTEVEVLCAFRPETIDALWKIDRQWCLPPGRVKEYVPTENFIVTGNAAFDRQEVQAYEKIYHAYQPTKKRAVLVPCAADKPYPSPMHKAVLDIMPPEYYMINATGVLGLVPQDLWPVMPHYDSGVPKRWRVLREVGYYFTRFEHEHIIVYSDFYGEAICDGLILAGKVPQTTFVITPIFRPDYMDLTDRDLLEKLRRSFKRNPS